jgi:hypothetical protein
MSTLIASEEWDLVGGWNGHDLGAITLYKKVKGERVYFGSVPSARVKCYRWLNGEPEAWGASLGSGETTGRRADPRPDPRSTA